MKQYDHDKAGEFFRAKTSFTTGSHELEVLVNSRKNPATYQVVDVRYPADFAAGHVPGAISLPKGKWQQTKELNKDATLYLYCYSQTCHLAAEAAVELVAQGYRVVEVEGGWDTWVRNGYGIEVQVRSA